MKNHLINFIFLFFFAFGNFSFSPATMDDSGHEVVITSMKNANFQFSIPEKFVVNNQLTTSMTLTFTSQNSNSTYAMNTISATVTLPWDLNGNFVLEIEIGGHIETHSISL